MRLVVFFIGVFFLLTKCNASEENLDFEVEIITNFSSQKSKEPKVILQLVPDLKFYVLITNKADQVVVVPGVGSYELDFALNFLLVKEGEKSGYKIERRPRTVLTDGSSKMELSKNEKFILECNFFDGSWYCEKHDFEGIRWKGTIIANYSLKTKNGVKVFKSKPQKFIIALPLEEKEIESILKTESEKMVE